MNKSASSTARRELCTLQTVGGTGGFKRETGIKYLLADSLSATGGLAQQMQLSALGQGEEVSPGTPDLKSSSSLFQRAEAARLRGCSLFTRVVHKEGWQF